jgi:hypothetical protein
MLSLFHFDKSLIELPNLTRQYQYYNDSKSKLSSEEFLRLASLCDLIGQENYFLQQFDEAKRLIY